MATGFAIERRPCQIRALEETTAAIAAGSKRVCVTSPTGSGKTRMIIDMLEWASEHGRASALYTNRRILFKQTSDTLTDHGVDHGKRASEHETALLRNVQICMTQTELSKVYKNKERELHNADFVAIDEAHSQTADTMGQIMTDHIEAGGACAGYTATPLDIGHLYDELIIAGTVSECLERGELIPAVMYAPDDVDLKHIKKYQVGDDLTHAQNKKLIMVDGIFGRVVNNLRAINPEQKPTILFAPGVAESIWFAQHLTANGIRAASIDGNNCWVDGEFYKSNEDMRQEIADQSRDGSIKVVCNRYVLREGVDWPWLAHGILATVFGSLTSYIQAAGRLLRCFEGLSHVTIQDHGGNYHRHGPVDVDRRWALEYTNHIACSLRQEKLRDKKISEPITCPKCFAVRWKGNRCPQCGYVCGQKSRMVVQVDGTLKAVEGDIYKPKRVLQKHDTLTKWTSMYHRARKSGRTFNQAAGYFAVENYYWPPKNLALMPTDPLDWFRKVADVPRERLQ